MGTSERDDIAMLSAVYIQSDDRSSSRSREFSVRNRSASMPMPARSLDYSENEHNLVGSTGPLRNKRRTPLVQMSGPLYVNRNREFIFQRPQGALRQNTIEPEMERYVSIDITENKDWQSDDYVDKNEHLAKARRLGMCSDPYCTTCPMNQSRISDIFDAKFHNMLYEDAKGWAKRMCSFLCPYIPGVMNPYTQVVRQWNKFFVISCLAAVFLDPLFFFLFSVQQDNNCIILNRSLTTTIFFLRSMTDFIYMLHILLQFRLAYVARESRGAGSGALVDDPKKIARNYFFGYFSIDVFIVLPLPQIIILLILSDSTRDSSAYDAKSLLQVAVLVQYIPRVCRLLALSSLDNLIFETTLSNFFINLLIVVLVSHVVGSCWYYFGLRRVNQCFRDACRKSNITKCMDFIDCGHRNGYQEFRNDPTRELWKNNEDAAACFGDGGFEFGIYKTTVNLTTHESGVTRYVYSLFWGFQQISTLAGNQVPSFFLFEVLFTMVIIGVGLYLFALLIGNIQNFSQALGSRRLERFIRRRDIERWMNHRHLPEELRRQVLDSEEFTWNATRGSVNEEMLMENLPEDLQREIRRHLFKFVKKIRIFQLLDEPIIDAICERLRTKRYIWRSRILFHGGLVDKMVFIIRGKMESIGEDGTAYPLCEGDVCGEELLTWCLEHSSVNKGERIRIPGPRLLSKRLVRCLTNVEACVLRGADLEEVTNLFARFLRNPRVQGAIRYESPYWRGLAARQIQVAWRYRKKRISRADSSNPPHN